MKTTIANLLLILFVFYCGTLAFLYFKQGSFIFFPTGISKSKEFLLKQFSQFEVNINHDGFNLHGWFMNRGISPEHPLIIYYGGNAEEVSNNLFDLEKYEKESLLFAVMEKVPAVPAKPVFFRTPYLSSTIFQIHIAFPQPILFSWVAA